MASKKKKLKKDSSTSTGPSSSLGTSSSRPAPATAATSSTASSSSAPNDPIAAATAPTSDEPDTSRWNILQWLQYFQSLPASSLQALKLSNAEPSKQAQIPKATSSTTSSTPSTSKVTKRLTTTPTSTQPVLPSTVTPPTSPIPIGPVQEFRTKSFKNDGKDVVFKSSTPLFQYIANEPAFGEIHEIETRFIEYIHDYSGRFKNPLHGHMYFTYYYFNAAILFLYGPRPSFPQFLKALFYNGKGKGPRSFGHLGEAFKGVSKNDDFWKALQLFEALENGGIVLHVGHAYLDEHVSLNREGAVIKLLFEQLTNVDRGEFPGIELDSAKNVYVKNPDEKADKRVYPREAREYRDDGIEVFGIYTLYHAYQSFLHRSHNTIQKSHLKVLLKEKKPPKTAPEQAEILSYRTYLISRDFSNALQEAMTNQSCDNRTYRLLERYFALQNPQQYFIFMFLDGSKLDDEKLNETPFEKYLESISCIGIANNMAYPYNLILENGVNSEILPLRQHIDDIFARKKGIFIHTTFYISNENDAFVKKGSMLAVLKKQFLTAQNVTQIRDLSNGIINTTMKLEENGVSCLYKTWKAFQALTPSRLYPEYFYW